MKHATWAVLVCVLAAGCGEVEPPPAPAKAVQPTVFRFDRTNEVIKLEEVAAARGGQTVTADFNLDGLEDVAVVEHGATDGETQVTIYVRRPVSGGQGLTELVTYYRGGWVRPSAKGKVIGVMSRRREQYTDLILLMSRTNAANEMVHFYSDGKSFSLQEEQKKTPAE